MTKIMMVLIAGVFAAGCSPDDEAPENLSETQRSDSALAPGEAATFEAPSTANLGGSLANDETYTYVPGYIEVDRLGDGASSDFGDANLHAFSGSAAQLAACTPGSGADPADGTCDARLPETNYAACTSSTQTSACACTGDASKDTDTCVEVAYIDWNELLTNAAGFPNLDAMAAHRLLDTVKTDGSSFKNGSCVTETKVLGKMDLTAAAVANNSEYSYLALKRFDNNGDAGYSWIFNTIAPSLDATWGGCSDGEPLVYTLTQGDVLIVGNFNPSSGADLVVRRVTAAADGYRLLAQDVVDPLGTLPNGDAIWEPIPGSKNLAAVNTTDTGVGVLEVIDGVDQAGNRTDRNAVSGSPGSYAVGPNIFAEAAVDFRVFTGGNDSLCEQRFYGSVITQPSSSKTSDLKDLLGPQLFNFGSMQVEAEVAPSCDKELTYAVTSLSAPGIETTDPDSISGVVCNWTFTHTDGTEKTANDCSGTLPFDPADPTGVWTAAVDVAIASGVSCSTARTVGTVTVEESLDASASAAPGCGLDFDYTGTITGGSSAATGSWKFEGVGSTSDAPASDLAGTVTVSEAGTYSATLTVEDVRDDISCTDTAAASVTIAAALAVTPTLTASCDLSFGFDAAVTGGLGSPTVAWTFSGPGTTTPATSNNASGNVTVDADGTYTGSVTVSETRGSDTCTATGTATVDAYAPLQPSVQLDETCALGFDYDSSLTGGSGAVTYSWAFTGAGSATPASSTSTEGSVAVSAAGAYSAALTVTDSRTDASCSAQASGNITVYEALQITKADLSPTCGRDFNYAATYTGGSPQASVGWAFSGAGNVTPATSGALSGSASVDADGAYTGVFSVTDVMPNGLPCTVSSSDSVAAYAPLTVSASTTDRCDSSFDYGSTLTGGSGSASYAWTITGPGTVSGATLDAADGNASVSQANADYTAALVVTDNRTDITCTASDSAGAHPLAPITVDIKPGAAALACTDGNDAGFSDSITYTANPAGGDGAYTFSWTGCTPSADGLTCVVDPNDSTFCADQDVQVVVDDASLVCAPKPSEKETYSKRTVVTSTDN